MAVCYCYNHCLQNIYWIRNRKQILLFLSVILFCAQPIIFTNVKNLGFFFSFPSMCSVDPRAICTLWNLVIDIIHPSSFWCLWAKKKSNLLFIRELRFLVHWPNEFIFQLKWREVCVCISLLASLIFILSFVVRKADLSHQSHLVCDIFFLCFSWSKFAVVIKFVIKYTISKLGFVFRLITSMSRSICYKRVKC